MPLRMRSRPTSAHRHRGRCEANAAGHSTQEFCTLKSYRARRSPGCSSAANSTARVGRTSPFSGSVPLRSRLLESNPAPWHPS
jgi:hypothetical protein